MGSHPSKGGSHAERLEHLRQSPFGVIIKEEELPEFLKCWEPIVARRGDHLPSNCGETYFICEGDIDVSTVLPKVTADEKTSEGVYVELCSKKKGQLLNLAVTIENALETANYATETQKKQATKLISKLDTSTMVCTSEHGDLLKLNRSELKIFTKAHPETGDKLKTVLSADLIDYLKEIPFLHGLPSSKLILFSKMCSYESFQPGEDVFREHTMGESMSICIFGKFEISTTESTDVDMSAAEKKKKIFANVNPGDFFGEMSLIVNMPRLANVTAIERSLVITVDKQNFCNFIKVVPELGQRLRDDVQRRMMEKLYACKIPFFAGVSIEKLLSLSDYCKIVEAKAMQTIIKQGQETSNFFMIVCGSCKIEVDDAAKDSRQSVLVNTCGPGAYFGELSMVLNEETHATVTATEQSVLLSISPEHFPLFFGDNIHMMAEVRIRLGGDKVPLRHFLTHTKGRQLFSEHMLREHSEEHLLMYDAIVQHENEYEKDEEDGGRPTSVEMRIRNINAIFEKFIRGGAPQEVNVPSTMKDEISVEIENGTGNIGCFNNVKVEVHQLMERDNFARFKKGSEFTAFINEIGGMYIGVHKHEGEGQRYKSIQITHMVRSMRDRSPASVGDGRNLNK